MKKYLLLIILLIVPLKVSAASSSISCPASATIGQNVTCSVNVTHSGLTGVSLKFSLTGASFVSCSPAAIFNGSRLCSANGAALTTTQTTNGGTVLTFVVKVNSASQIAINTVEVSDSAYNNFTANNSSASIRIKSTDNVLSSITVGSQVYNSPAQTINLSLNAASTNISAVAPAGARVSGTGYKALNYGLNKFVLTSTSESGSPRYYTINITRPDNRSSNNNLKTLTTTPGSLSFNSSTLKYKVEVASSVSSVKIAATLADTKAKFVSYPQSLNLNYGSNYANIKVQAENGAVKTYTIEVVRKDDRSSDNLLKSLTIKDFDIDFSSDKTSYEMTVPNEVTKLELEPIINSEVAKMNITNPDLTVGLNKVTIVVTAENGSAKTYEINVTRSQKGVKLSDDNYLKSLEVSGYQIDFKKDKLKYELLIKQDYDLNIKATTQSSKAKYEITGNKSLKNGSRIKITVLSESSKKRTYEILIKQKRELPSSVLISMGVVAGLILAIVLNKIIVKVLKKGQ